MGNTIFFNDSKKFFNQVMQRNILNIGYGDMKTFCGKFLSQKNRGKVKEVVYETDKLFLKEKLGKLNEAVEKSGEIGTKLMQNHTYKGVQSLFIEEIEGIYATQAYAEGIRYVLKNDSCKTFTYRRYQDPESTAYVEYHPETLYVEWLGYMDQSKKIKHRAKAVLELAIAYEDQERCFLEALLPSRSKDKMCKYYESIGFEFDGFRKIPISESSYPNDYESIPRFSAGYSLSF
jgi:hypothetical protein